MKPNSYLIAEVVTTVALLTCAVVMVLTGHPTWAWLFLVLTFFVSAGKVGS